MQKLRVVVVGAGGRATKGLLPALKGNTDVVLSAANDKNQPSMSRHMRCVAYTDRPFHRRGDCSWPGGRLDRGYASAVRAVYIIPALEAGIPVFCEKPLATTSSEAKYIQKVSESTAVPVVVGYHIRHQAAFNKIVTLVRSMLDQKGRLEIFASWGYQIRETAPNAHWKIGSDRACDSPIQDVGSHVLDLLLGIDPDLHPVSTCLSRPTSSGYCHRHQVRLQYSVGHSASIRLSTRDQSGKLIADQLR